MMQSKPTENTTLPEMTEALSPELKALYRYPVKGLTPERLDQVLLVADETFGQSARELLASWHVE